MYLLSCIILQVSVDTSNYDVLRIWGLGRETEQIKTPFLTRMKTVLTRAKAVPKSMDFYKRVVIAVRLKRDEKLILKAFKNVPVNALEQLMPDGKIKMSKLDNVFITSSVVLASLGIVGKFISYLAHVYVQWTLLASGIFGLTAVRTWTVYKNRRNSYMVELNRMLYYKNIANNRGLLTLLVDRAEDELFKEALLTYAFLLTNRPSSEGVKTSADQDMTRLGNL